MIFVKYVLFLALLSISSAVPIVSDDGNQVLLNGSSHLVEKRTNPKGSQSLLDEGLVPRVVYLLRKKNKMPVPIICLDPVVNKHGDPIPKQFHAVELVKTSKPFSEKRNTFKNTLPADHYLDPKDSIDILGTTLMLAAFSVKLSPQIVNEQDVDGKKWAEVTVERWGRLQKDISDFRSRPLQLGALYKLKRKNEILVSIPVICMGDVPDEPGYFDMIELVKTTTPNLQQKKDQRRLGDMPSVRNFFQGNRLLWGDTWLYTFSVKLSLQKVNEKDVDKTVLAQVSAAGWGKLGGTFSKYFENLRMAEFEMPMSSKDADIRMTE